MTPNQPVRQLTEQMSLDGSTRRPMTSEKRVMRENSTPEERAAVATAKFKRAEEGLCLKKSYDEARDFHVELIHGHKLSTSVAACQKAVTIDDLTLRAALREMFEQGFHAGWLARSRQLL